MEQAAQAHVLRRAMEEGSYFYFAFLRWSTANSYDYVQNLFKKLIPKWIFPLVMPKIRKKFLASLRSQGAGRHSPESLYKLAMDDIAAYSVLLGKRKYFMGDRVCSLDATMFGFLIQVLWVPWDSPLKEFALSKENLVTYCERIYQVFWIQGD